MAFSCFFNVPVIFEASCVVTLPAVAVGAAFWAICGADGVQITLSPNGSDLWLYAVDGAASADDKDIILTAATAKKGDYCKFSYGDATGWMITERAGTWADEA